MSETGPSGTSLELNDEGSWEFLIHETAEIVKREIDDRHAIGKRTTKDLRQARNRLSEEQAHFTDSEHPPSVRYDMDLAQEVIIPHNPDGFMRSSRANYPSLKQGS